MSNKKANAIVKNLDKYMRENINTKGVDYYEWQEYLQKEIEGALLETEVEVARHNTYLSRVILICTTITTTIGFWGLITALYNNSTLELIFVFMFLLGIFAFILMPNIGIIIYDKNHSK